ncbi:type II toxin-antitoxin system VapC family toxin [Neorhizobium galegae]|uniref:Type II toxin-antitoxin system VapC family toxin n=1 Tax=Neorhizobium galegae TaxID=399 RepID=A0A6A1TMA4_NEOGA|nr:type II toxin-antitoxin system VapC family toxin [Neorhizobium galegae]KAB1085832.1 type II toxin-antitoxin system VapC family toxin [Neorhizobium galegae]
MTTFVVDASAVIKWVIQETGTSEALSLLGDNALIAPDLILVECANTLWKKVRRRELSAVEAHFGARLIEGSDLQLREMLPILNASLELAIELDHPAYDCIYLALALKENLRFVTADESLVRKLRQSADKRFRDAAISLSELA